MDKKTLIRKKYLLKRKNNYFQIKKSFFLPLIKLLKNTKKKNISIYYPSFYEVDILKIFEISFFKRFKFLLPAIEENNQMNFYYWKKNEILQLNKFGIPEPFKNKKGIPNIILVPLLAFDSTKNRLGYGKGFYDRYLNKFKSLNKKTISIGVAFSFQKHKNLPLNKKDFQLDYIITEKGVI